MSEAFLGNTSTSIVPGKVFYREEGHHAPARVLMVLMRNDAAHDNYLFPVMPPRLTAHELRSWEAGSVSSRY